MSSPKGSDLDYDLDEVLGAFDERYGERVDAQRLRKLQAALKFTNMRIEELKALGSELECDDAVSLLDGLPSSDPKNTVEDHESRLGQLVTAIEECQIRIQDSYQERIIREKRGFKSLAEAANTLAAECVTARSFQSSFKVETQLSSSARDRVVVARYLAKARKVLDEFTQRSPEHVVPASLIESADSLICAANAKQVQTRYDRFFSAIKGEELRCRQQQARERERIEKLQQERARVAVGSLIAGTLEDMGYEVSGIDESCFVRNGELYAQSHKYPGYVAKLTMDGETSAIRCESVRLETDSAMASDSATYGRAEKDHEYDSYWCSRDQLGELQRRTAEKGLVTRFNVIEKGAPPVARMARSKLPDLEGDRNEMPDELLEIIATGEREMEMDIGGNS